jgi:hypothetical protein
MTGNPDLASLAECERCGEIAAAEEGFDVFKWAAAHGAANAGHVVNIYTPELGEP